MNIYLLARRAAIDDEGAVANRFKEDPFLGLGDGNGGEGAALGEEKGEIIGLADGAIKAVNPLEGRGFL